MNQIYGLVLAFLLGAILYGLLRPWGMKKIRQFQGRAPLIRKYWLVVIPFAILTAVAYILVAFYANNQTNFEILGQVSSLIFTIFVGYIAFSEWSRSKFDGLVTNGRGYTEQGKFKAAVQSFEEAHSLQPKDADLLADLLELYLITEQDLKFDGKIDYYKSLILDKQEMLNYYYLLALRYLVVEYVRDAKDVIKESINFVSQNNDIRLKFQWSISELQNSERYKSLSTSTQRMTENYYAYLKNRLSIDQETRFLEGQYDTQGI